MGGAGMKRMLVVAAHPDDEVLGCGGSIARFVEAEREIAIMHVCRPRTFNLGLCAGDAARILGVRELYQNGPEAFTDQHLDAVPRVDVVAWIETVAHEFRPDTVLTHSRSDRNLDHRIVYDAVRTAFRPKPGGSLETVLCFEVPSSTEWGDAWKPNHYIELEARHVAKKLAALDAYQDEMRQPPHPRSRYNIDMLSKVRGAEAGVSFAEAFSVEWSLGRI
jgi:LmbE family N-acetylglucosaminyl deacetylase